VLKKQEQDFSQSKRSFSSYNLLNSTVISNDDEGTWYSVQLSVQSNNSVQLSEHKQDESVQSNVLEHNYSVQLSEHKQDVSVLSSAHKHDESVQLSEHKQGLQTPSKPRKAGENGDIVQDQEMACSVDIRILTPKISIDQLSGFNNTGNVCIWPSEECLALYAIKHKELFVDRKVMELGGGQTCLAGLAAARLCSPRSVMLSDGNQDSVNNLGKIVERNPGLNLDSQLYRWTEQTNHQLEGILDILLVADCLFFEEGREGLVAHLHHLLGKGGKALVMAPRRGDTLDKFVSLCSALFTVEPVEDYDDDVTKLHNRLVQEDHYTPDIHQPKLIILHKKL